MTAAMIQLSIDEKIELSHLEAAIEHGLKAWWEAGQALRKIQEGKLYRATHSTFEEYCGDRWNLSRPRAYQLMEGADIILNLSTTVDNAADALTERQVRPLAQLEPEDQPTALLAAQSIAPATPPTSATVARAVQAVKSKASPAFEPGDRATVVDEKSDYYGQQVEILKPDGLIVECAIEGKKIGFFANEISKESPQHLAPVGAIATPEKAGKSDRLEGLLAAQEVDQMRIQILEGYLVSAIGYLERITDDDEVDGFLKEVRSVVM